MAYPPNIPHKPRALLTAGQAIEIFKQKKSGFSAGKVAGGYGVSEKAVRDIWKGRTWSKMTNHLDLARANLPKTAYRPKVRIVIVKPRMKRQVALSKPGPTSQFNNSETADIASAVALHKNPSALISWVVSMNSGNREVCPERQKALAIDKSLSCCSACQSVDDLLSVWDKTLWINLQNPDPFRDDWTPALCPCC